MKRSKIIAALAAAGVLIAAVVCAVLLWPRNKPDESKWLSRFEAGFDAVRIATDDEGNAFPTDISRRIEIRQSGQIVAVYAQRLQISIDGTDKAAYLLAEESFPTDETGADDLRDEYYLSGGTMRTRRVQGGEVQISRFDSGIAAILTVASENMNISGYDFSKENFLPQEEGTRLIRREGERDRLSARISPDRYGAFFKDVTAPAGMTNVTLIASTRAGRFESLRLSYDKDGLRTSITISSYDPQPVLPPEWV